MYLAISCSTVYYSMLPKANISSSRKTELTPAFIVAYILLIYSKKLPLFDMATLRKLVSFAGMLLKVILLKLHLHVNCVGHKSWYTLTPLGGVYLYFYLYLYLHLSCIVGARR